MRRHDREIVDFREILAVMERCDVCRVALHDEPYPYIVPMNFGMAVEGERIVLYFHGAKAGRKFDLIAKNPRVAFEMDCGHALALDEAHQNCTMSYASVMGDGVIELLPESERDAALRVLLAHYRAEGFPYNPKMIPVTNVMKLTVHTVTGKRRVLPH